MTDNAKRLADLCAKGIETLKIQDNPEYLRAYLTGFLSSCISENSPLREVNDITPEGSRMTAFAIPISAEDKEKLDVGNAFDNLGTGSISRNPSGREEQLEAKLAAVSSAALGYKDNLPVPNEYAWSPSLEDVIYLRENFEILYSGIKKYIAYNRDTVLEDYLYEVKANMRKRGGL